MPLADLALEPEYRSDRASLAREFFAPCLERSRKYSRAVGYFQSSSLTVLADGLQGFLATEGTMRLVASPKLDPRDAAALEQGYEARSEAIRRAVAGEIERFEELPHPERQRLECLAWLVANDRLDLKLALVLGSNSIGMYHEKIGCFEDEIGDAVAFSGSANESFGGLVANFESIDVYCSWVESDRERVARKQDAFERLWDARTAGIEVHEFPVAARRKLIELVPPSGQVAVPGFPDPVIEPGESPYGFPVFPSGFEARDYQQMAVRAWLQAQGRGILAMATGTGKTLTALSIVVQVARRAREQERPLLAIITAPQKHLVTQWADEASAFGIRPILCFESVDFWTDEADAARSALNGNRAPFSLWITTNATFRSRPFQSRLERIDVPIMFVADEMHNLGAAESLDLLPNRASFRLGLSATPERRFDEAGTEALFDYFGPTVYELSLEDAIARGILTGYRYRPVLVDFEGEELEEYVDLSEAIARSWASSPDEEMSPIVEKLLMKRARLIGGARGKLTALKTEIAAVSDERYTLVYCADTTVNGTETRQIDAAVDLLGTRLRMRVAPYTHVTSTAQRRRVLRLFDEGDLNALVAIRCLDEGVDIPATRRAYILASSTNPREYVQRRGRVLRRHKDKRWAEIVDFIAVPPSGALGDSAFEAERRLVTRELTRVIEFARHAENGAAALAALLPLQERYGLLHLGI